MTTRLDPINSHAARIGELGEMIARADVSGMSAVDAARTLVTLEKVRARLAVLLDVVRTAKPADVGPLFKRA